MKTKAGAVRRTSSVLHVGFEVAILLKGVHAVLEMIGGVLLWLINPATLDMAIRVLTQNELAEDPTDLIANLLLRASERYTVQAQHFGVMYLLSHGLVKVVLVLLLWRRKLWAYPLAVAVLGVFIAYQVFRWTSTRSTFLIALSLLDALLIALTLVEYARLKREPEPISGRKRQNA